MRPTTALLFACGLLLFAACGRIAFDTGAELADATQDSAALADATEDSAALTCTIEDFDDGMAPAWNPWTSAAGFLVQLGGGYAAIMLAPNANGYAGLDLLQSIDLTGGRATVEVPMVTGAMSAESYLMVYSTSTDAYLMFYEQGNLNMVRRIGAADLREFVPYDPVQHRHWRISHQPQTSSIVFETSADRVSWTARASMPATVPVSSVRVELAAGTYNSGTSQPGTPRYDNVELCVDGSP